MRGMGPGGIYSDLGQVGNEDASGNAHSTDEQTTQTQKQARLHLVQARLQPGQVKLGRYLSTRKVTACGRPSFFFWCASRQQRIVEFSVQDGHRYLYLPLMELHPDFQYSV